MGALFHILNRKEAMSDRTLPHPEPTPFALLTSTFSNWHSLAERVLAGYSISSAEGLHILQSSDDELLDLLAAAYRIRRRWFGRHVDLNFLINAKSGDCSEDCAYCSQSGMSSAAIPKYGMLPDEEIWAGAKAAVPVGRRPIAS